MIHLSPSNMHSALHILASGQLRVGVTCTASRRSSVALPIQVRCSTPTGGHVFGPRSVLASGSPTRPCERRRRTIIALAGAVMRNFWGILQPPQFLSSLWPEITTVCISGTILVSAHASAVDDQGCLSATQLGGRLPCHVFHSPLLWNASLLTHIHAKYMKQA